MISICIPVYNFVIVDTVRKLLQSADQWDIDVEVVVFDDDSNPYFKEQNQVLRNEPRVRYLPLIENIGRSKIRNRLADLARGEWLIFMDCDMVPESEFYLQRYQEKTLDRVDVVCGGIAYGPLPADKTERLRWRWEKRNERHREYIKRRSLHMPITTGNFMIRRDLYQEVRCNEQLMGYGQEDQLLSLELKNRNARVEWIDNPMRHLGVEPNEDFLRKVEESTINLVRIWNANPDFRHTMLRTSKRLKAVRILRRLGVANPTERVFSLCMGVLRNRILHGDTWMWYFNVYQLGYLLMTLRRPNLKRLTHRAKRFSLAA